MSRTILYSILIMGLASSWMIFQPVVMAQSDVDLSVSAMTDETTVPINSNFTYIITVENLGTDHATFVTLTDDLPLGLTFLTSPDACVVTGARVQCDIGDLAAGESVTLSYVVRASIAESQITNTVAVQGAQTEGQTTNNLASSSIDVVVPTSVDIALSASLSESTLDISNELTITFTLTNADSSDAYQAIVEFVLPTQVEFISSSSCTARGTIVICQAGTILSGTPTTINLVVRALSPGNPITVSAIASHFMTDTNSNNNAASVAFVINDSPPDSANLDLMVTTSNSQVVVGETQFINYTLINLGPARASNIQITHNLPSELTFIASDDCVLVSNGITCSVGDLAVNQSYTATIAIASNQVSGDIISTINVSGDEFDPNMFNNIDTIVMTSVADVVPITATIPTTTPVVTETITPTATLTPTLVPAVQVISTQAQPASPPDAPAEPSSQQETTRSNSPNSDTATNTTQGGGPLPDGIAPSDIYGWTRYESVDLIQVIGNWQLRNMSNASDGAYHESRENGALLQYPFEGDGFRIGYRSEVSGAGIQVSVDGELVDTITTDALQIDPELAPLRQTFVTQPYWVETGYHLVDLVCLADGAGSEGCNIDYIEVFIGPPIPIVEQPTLVVIPNSESLVVISDVELISAPPTLAPTNTPIAPSIMTVDVLVTADLNANGQVDANEGIEGMTVRAVAVADNSLLATSVTDASGFVRITNATTSDVILLIPALGESYYVRNRGQSVNDTWNLLLDPVNIPGLIP